MPVYLIVELMRLVQVLAMASCRSQGCSVAQWALLAQDWRWTVKGELEGAKREGHSARARKAACWEAQLAEAEGMVGCL